MVRPVMKPGIKDAIRRLARKNVPNPAFDQEARAQLFGFCCDDGLCLQGCLVLVGAAWLAESGGSLSR